MAATETGIPREAVVKHRELGKNKTKKIFHECPENSVDGTKGNSTANDVSPWVNIVQCIYIYIYG